MPVMSDMLHAGRVHRREADHRIYREEMRRHAVDTTAVPSDGRESVDGPAGPRPDGRRPDARRWGPGVTRRTRSPWWVDAARGAVAGAVATWVMDLATTGLFEAQSEEVTAREEAARPE